MHMYYIRIRANEENKTTQYHSHMHIYGSLCITQKQKHSTSRL